MLPCQLFTTFSLNHAVGQVSFISDKNFCYITACVGLDLLEPVADVVEGSLLSTIVNQNDPHRPFIVGLSNRTEALLTCSIPNLELDFLAVNIDRLDFEIDA